MAFRLTVDYQKVSLTKASITHQAMRASSAYEIFSLADVYLDPDTLNKWFTAAQDSPDALTITMSEALATSTSLSKTEAVAIAEAATLAFSTPKADSYTVSDALAKALELAQVDTPTLSEALGMAVSMAGIDDSLSPIEAASLLVSIVASDAFGMDDTSSVDDVLKTDVAMAKGNITTLSEASVFSFSSIYTDSATMDETLSFQVVGRLVNSATFNASALN